jgi:hypothetical protein
METGVTITNEAFEDSDPVSLTVTLSEFTDMAGDEITRCALPLAKDWNHTLAVRSVLAPTCNELEETLPEGTTSALADEVTTKVGLEELPVFTTTVLMSKRIAVVDPLLTCAFLLSLAVI